MFFMLSFPADSWVRAETYLFQAAQFFEISTFVQSAFYKFPALLNIRFGYIVGACAAMFVVFACDDIVRKPRQKAPYLMGHDSKRVGVIAILIRWYFAWSRRPQGVLYD